MLPWRGHRYHEYTLCSSPPRCVSQPAAYQTKSVGHLPNERHRPASVVSYDPVQCVFWRSLAIVAGAVAAWASHRAVFDPVADLMERLRHPVRWAFAHPIQAIRRRSRSNRYQWRREPTARSAL